MTYNFKRHLELLKHFRVFKNQKLGSSSDNDQRELVQYEIMVELYLHWERRFMYLSMMKDYIDGLTSAAEFTDRFVGLRQIELNECDAFLKKLESEEMEDYQIKKLEKLKKFDYQRGSKFRKLLTFIYLECDEYVDIYEYEDDDYDADYDFTDEIEAFYESIKKCYSIANFLINSLSEE